MAKAPQTALERIKALDTERAKIMESAKGEAMGKVEEALSELNALGFNYRVTEGAMRKSGNGTRKGTRHVNPDRECPLCKFKTTPPHDARAHRSQKQKGPFSAKELEARNFTRA